MGRVWSCVKVSVRGICWRMQRGLSIRTRCVSEKMMFGGRSLLMVCWVLDMTLLYANLAGKNPPPIPPVLSLSQMDRPCCCLCLRLFPKLRKISFYILFGSWKRIINENPEKKWHHFFITCRKQVKSLNPRFSPF